MRFARACAVLAGQVHQQAEDPHGPDDHRARWQVGDQRNAESHDITADGERVAKNQLPPRLMPIGRDRRDDQRGEHQVHTDELHGGRDDHGEQHVEPNAPDALAQCEPHQRRTLRSAPRYG